MSALTSISQGETSSPLQSMNPSLKFSATIFYGPFKHVNVAGYAATTGGVPPENPDWQHEADQYCSGTLRRMIQWFEVGSGKVDGHPMVRWFFTTDSQATQIKSRLQEANIALLGESTTPREEGAAAWLAIVNTDDEELLSSIIRG